MPGYTRHDLKHDRLTDATDATVSWAVAHRSKVVGAAIVLGILLLAALGGWYYLQLRNQKASLALGEAVRIYESPLASAGVPPQPGVTTFPSAAERAKAAQQKFQAIADEYRWTKSAEIARYMAGVTAAEAGDTATGERELKAVAGSGNKDLSALAKMALAAVYRSSGRDGEAVAIYDQLAQNPTGSVSKSAALLAKADTLRKSQPAEAARLYQQIRTEDPEGAAGRIAGERLNGR